VLEAEPVPHGFDALLSGLVAELPV
jgi:hypothetical protein